MLPFNLSFPADAVVFVVDEYSQYKKAMLDDYCYTHSPIVITDIGQLVGKQAPPANKNLLLDCVLKWDDSRQYNNVADVLRYHTTGLLIHMNKPAAFDPLIRAKVDYLVLFRGRNLRHLHRIQRQYLSSVLDDKAVLSGLFKSLSWGQGLVLDLAAMQSSGRFAGNYYKYSPSVEESIPSTQSGCTYANLDVALGDWIASAQPIYISPVDANTSLTTSPIEPVNTEWEMINTHDYIDARPAQITPITADTSSTNPDKIIEQSTEEEKPITADTSSTSPDKIIEQPATDNTEKEEQLTAEQPKSDQPKPEGWVSYIYSKAWSWLG
jgi:hypothetical protein